MSLRGRGNLTPVETHRIEGKCGYPCLTPNALLHNIAVCSAQDALLGIESIYIYECPLLSIAVCSAWDACLFGVRDSE